MSRIIFATGNTDKMAEIREILKDLGMEILSMKEAGVNPEIVENGKTFEENSLIKARAVHALLPDDVVMADDSGLEIDYLCLKNHSRNLHAPLCGYFTRIQLP